MHFLIGLLVVVAIFLIAWHFAPQGWRTIVFNALASVPIVGPPIADALLGVDWTVFFDKASATAVALGIAVFNAILRTITSTPVGKKPDGQGEPWQSSDGS